MRNNIRVEKALLGHYYALICILFGHLPFDVMETKTDNKKKKREERFNTSRYKDIIRSN